MKNQILVFGGLLQDCYISVDHWPQRGQDGMIDDEHSFVGGCAINMAVTAANLIASENLPASDSGDSNGKDINSGDSDSKDSNRGDAVGDLSVHVVSALGKDATSQWICDYMEEHDLSLQYTDIQPGSTGKCYVFLEPDGERTFLTKKGVEENFSQELADKILADGCLVAGVTGYYLLNPDADRLMQVLKELKKQGSRILFDPSPLVGYIKPEILKDIVELADVMTPNETEIKEICKIVGTLEADNHKTIFLKNGSKGGHVYYPDGDFSYGIVKTTVVDTTGAGDSFAGALLYAMCCQLPIQEMTRIAAESSAKTVEIFGPHGFWEADFL